MTVDEIKGETPVDTPRLTSRDRLRSGDSGIQFVSWKQDRKKERKKEKKQKRYRDFKADMSRHQLQT